jgi:hypothetical protein
VIHVSLIDREGKWLIGFGYEKLFFSTEADITK